MTVQLRAISVVLAVCAAEVSAAIPEFVPPNRLTVLPLQIVVPFVPSSAASATRMFSMDCGVNAPALIYTCPAHDFNE